MLFVELVKQMDALSLERQSDLAVLIANEIVPEPEG